MSDTMQLFYEFLLDGEASDMYITGFAGTGKTTLLGDLLIWCAENNIEVIVCAYTHKACGVLRVKLPSTAVITTLHSYLRKRPTINVEADSIIKLQSNMQCDKPLAVQLLVVDEFSCIGEKDLMSIRELQDTEDGEGIAMKVLWVGDPYQLPPVKDQQTIVPVKPYWLKLTEQKRRDADNPLGEPISQLISFIDGAKPEALKTSSAFIRGIKDLVGAYVDCSDKDKIMLAYTNEQVQAMNFQAQGYIEPKPGDMLFSPSLHDTYTFVKKLDPFSVYQVDTYRGATIALNSKYKTLEFIIDQSLCEFFLVKDEESEEYIFPVIFGTNNYKVEKEIAAQLATRLNKQIIAQYKVDNVTNWAKQNYDNALAKQRALAWRKYLSINDAVMCFDFNHAITVHKSQGSTYNEVFVDTDNIGICSSKDYMLYLKLMYVALSRASKRVTTN